MKLRPVFVGLGLVALSLCGGAAYLYRHAAAGQPRLEDTRPVTAAPSPRSALPDVWPVLLGISDADVPSESGRSALLQVVGAPNRADLERASVSSKALATVEGLDLGRANIRVPRRTASGEDGLRTEASDGLGAGPHAALKGLADARLVDGWKQALDGHTAAGTAEMLAAMQMGHLLVEGESDLHTTMVGMHIERRALRELRELLEGPARTDAQALARAAEALGQRGEGSVDRALAVEWQWIEGQLRTMPVPTLEELYPSGEGTDAWWLVCRLTELVPNGFQRDQVIAWSRTEGQRAVLQASAPRWEQPRVCDGQDLLHWAPFSSASATPWRTRLGALLHNPVGRGTMNITRVCFADLVEKADILRAEVRVLETWIAVQRQMLDTGLPHDPATLVPRWMATRPTDPFDGKPVRVEEGAVFSAGWEADDWMERGTATTGRRGGALRARPGLRIGVDRLADGDPQGL